MSMLPPPPPPPPGWGSPTPAWGAPGADPPPPSAWGGWTPAPPPALPPLPPQPRPRQPRPARSPGRALITIGVALLLLGGSGLIGATTFSASPNFPSKWDARVLDIVRFVERYRGHAFEHPVSVYFLSVEKYKKIAADDNSGTPTAKDREDAANSVAQYRALGLMQGDPDLLASSKTLFGEGTLAYYSPVSKIVNIKGTEMSVNLRVTLAHELTHALQDQYFDLMKIQRGGDSDRSGAVRSVIEGDAVATEKGYVDQLSESDRTEYIRQNNSDVDDSKATLTSVPDILKTQFSSLYELGRGFIELLQSKVGDPSPAPVESDEAFRRPPGSSAQLFEPLTFLAHVRPHHLDPPEQHGKQLEQSTFGASTLFLMLSERMPPAKAMTAVDGWRGDAYDSSKVTGPRGERVCVSANMAMATDADATELANALQTWRDNMPADNNISVEYAGGAATEVKFTTCDPGPKAPMKLTGQSNDAMNYPFTRLEVAASLIRGGLSREQAWCVSTKVVTQLSASDLTTEDQSILGRVRGLVTEAKALC